VQPPDVNSPLHAPRNTVGPRNKLKLFLASDYWVFVKWSLMSCALLWLLIYRLSEATQKLPDFVYVNF
jgi:hypothetical protein